MGWTDSSGQYHSDDYGQTTGLGNVLVTKSHRIPFRCPVCEGRGHVPNGFYYQTSDTANQPCQTCLPCGGTGIIWDPK